MYISIAYFFHNNFIADFTFVLYDHCIFQARISNLSSNHANDYFFFFLRKKGENLCYYYSYHL